MNKNLILFGVGKIAEVVFYYCQRECGFKVEAFCVDEKYKTDKTFKGLPVVTFNEVQKFFPPSEFDMFIAVGYQDMNSLREKKCMEAIEKGYSLASVISPKTNLPENVTSGWNCFIMPPSFIHPCVKIKNNVFIFNGALVAHHSIIEDNCWLTSGCNISGNVQIGANTFIAVNATIGHSVNIGKKCFLGANTLVVKDLEDEKVVIQESSKPLRVSSSQFLKISSFSNL
jgi:sugar O-acyltransferase (sialic acid O-acetyltransferase NeuD family)